MKFPLKLSCGHTTRKSLDDAGCNCHGGERKNARYSSTGPSPVDKALDQFLGQWRLVLSNYGCQLPGGGKHGPCPVCGGKDRFRFDDKNGRGTWFCSQCEPQSGGGLLLLSRYIGKSVMDTAKELVGDDELRTIPKKRVHTVDHDAARAASIEQAKKGAALLMASATKNTHEYLNNKGLFQDGLVNGDPIYSRDGVIGKGELLLVPIYKNGELVNVQKITKDGTKRPLYGGDMQGVQHIIDGTIKSIAVVEGYATGVTVNKLTKFKTYVSFNAANLEAAVRQAKEDHPSAKIIVFGDHDNIDPTHNRRPGEYYANKAADPFCAVVAIPPELGDWDDYRQAHGDDECKAAMRKAIGIKPKPSVEAVEPVPVQPEKPEITVANAPAFGSWLEKEKTKPKAGKDNKITLTSLPAGIDLSDIDVDRPPSIAGDIVDYMRDGAHRVLEGGAYSAMAMQILAMAASGIEGYDGASLNLITITLGVSAAGKERPQRVAKKLLKPNDIVLYGDIRSDKDLIRVLVDGAKCFYLKDEAHSILGQVADKDQNKAGIASMLLEIATSDDITLAAMHVGEFQDKMLTRIGRLEKMKIAKEDIRLGYNVEREQEKIKYVDAEIADFDNKIAESKSTYDQIGTGIENPALSLSGYSTPTELAGIINERTIGNGFLGRTIIVDCGDERSHLNKELVNVSDDFKDKMDVRYRQLLARVGAIKQMASDTSKKRIDKEFHGLDYKITASKDAQVLLSTISAHYDNEVFINHHRLGALYARLPSRVTSLSSILAVDNLVDGSLQIEAKHVLFSLKITLSSINYLHSNLRVNEAANGATVEDKLEGIKEAIIKRLSVSKTDKNNGWRYKSEIKNYLKRQKYYQQIAKELLNHNQDAMENALTVLRGEGKIIIDDKKIKKS